MANTRELAIAYVQILLIHEHTPPLTLMNHNPDEAAVVIGAVVDRCAELQVNLEQIIIGVELAEELGLRDGVHLKHGEMPIVSVNASLGRQIMFK